jgi:FkbM family methyltransferase
MRVVGRLLAMTLDGSHPNTYPLYRAVDWFLRHILRILPVSLWTEKCALWWGYRFQPAPGVAHLRSGARIHITHADHLQLLIYYLGTFEPYCLPFLRACAGKGGTVIDVGANIGFYTLESAVAVGSLGRVISIEAAPSHLHSLRQNLELNNMKNVSIVGSAVGDASGHAMLTLPRGNNLGMFTLGEVEGEEAYRVIISTIDDLLEKQNVQSVDLIKMDIEGSEFKALHGAAKTFQRFRPSLLIELNELALRRCGSSSQAVKGLLTEMGYRGWRIGRDAVDIMADDLVSDDCDECLYIHISNRSLMQKLDLPL